MKNYKSGDIIKINNMDFVVLDENGSKLFVLAKNTVGCSEFGETNNYAESELKHKVDGWLEKTGLKEDLIIPRTIDLTTLDGHKYGEMDVMAAPLTMDEARKYAEFIPNADKWFWLATGWDAPIYGATYGLGVGINGNWSGGGCSYSNGIRPALNISSELLDSENDPVDLSKVPTEYLIEEIKNRIQ